MLLKNPIVEICEQKELTPQQLAIIAGTSSATVARLIRGESISISSKIIEALVQFGYDRKYVSNQYERWRNELAKQMISERGM